MFEGSTFRRLLRIEPLEDRRLLANVTVSNLNDVVNGNTASIPLLIANPGPDGISLREAITAANADATADTVNIAVNGQISLSSLGQLTITKSLTINGPGDVLLRIRAYDPSVAVGDGHRVFNVDDGTNTSIFVSINDVTITGGDLGLNQVGGGVYNAEALQIVDSTIIDNRTLHVGGGIGSKSGSQLTISNCTVTGNSASNQVSLNGGGGVYAGPPIGSVPGRLVIITSNIYNNSAGVGGGVSALVNTVISGCTVTGNTAVYYGGGADVIAYLTVTGSTISGNNAGRRGGGVSGQTVNISYSSVSENSVTGNLGTGGGGVSGRGLITSCTISGNTSAGVGGGVAGGFVVTNSTISGNTAANAGGGVYRDLIRSMVIRHSTITGNTAPAGAGSGIASPATDNGYNVQLQSSIIAGNTNSDIDRLNGTVVTVKSLGYNLVGSGSAIAAFSAANGDKIGLNPLLGPLANNGGSTLTRAPLAGSPAIDAGNPSSVAGSGTVPLYDQRYFPHGRVQGARIDIGAFESAPVVPALLGDYNRDAGVNSADYVVWRKTLGTTGLVAFAGADGSGNGTIDEADYGVWRQNFGRTASGAAEGEVGGQSAIEVASSRAGEAAAFTGGLDRPRMNPRLGETRPRGVESLRDSTGLKLESMVWLDMLSEGSESPFGDLDAASPAAVAEDADAEAGLAGLDGFFESLAAG